MEKTSLAAAVAFASLALGTGMASAQAFSLEEPYIKAFGGATWPQDLDTTLREDGTQIARPSFDHDTGYTLGLAFGATVMPNLSMEVEFAHRKADFTVTDRDEGDQADGDTSANAFMFNALYMFDSMSPTTSVRPYAGGGIGGASVEVDASGQDFDTDTVFAYQLIGGVNYEVNPNVNIFVEGRWFGTESSDFDGPDGESFNGKFETWDMLLGMRYDF